MFIIHAPHTIEVHSPNKDTSVPSLLYFFPDNDNMFINFPMKFFMMFLSVL
jgi:hypothetical protein